MIFGNHLSPRRKSSFLLQILSLSPFFTSHRFLYHPLPKNKCLKIFCINLFTKATFGFFRIFIRNLGFCFQLLILSTFCFLAEAKLNDKPSNLNSESLKFHGANGKFVHAISIFGESKYPKNFLHLSYVNPSAPKGGEIKFGVEGGFNSLNNFILKGISAEGLGYLYDSLMEGTSDEIGTRYGLIAESARLAENRLSIEFKLRKNAFFHDNTKITAKDVLFTFNKLIADGHPSYKMAFRDVKDVNLINDFQIRFNFKSNQNRDLPLLIASLPVLPSHFYEKNDFSKTTLNPPLGSGPYKIKEVKPNHSIVFERVKNYWAQNLPINKGRYNFDQIRFDYYRDNNVLIEAFKAQKYDFRQENIARNWANSYDILAIKNGEIIKQEIRHNLPVATQAFILNLRKDKFQNIALRQAISLAFDFEWLREHIFYGAYTKTESYFANSEYAFNNPRKNLNFAQESFSIEQSKTSNLVADSRKLIDKSRNNLIVAQKILKEAGYKFKNFHLLDPKTNKPLEIEFLIDQKAFEMIIAPFIKNLKKLGISANIRFVEENQYQTRVNNFDFDIITSVYGQSSIPGSELFSYFHSSQKNIKGSRNLGGIDNREIDELVKKIAAAKTKNELKKLCHRLDEVLLSNHYAILQWHNNSYRILYRDIFGIPDSKPPYSLALDSWWKK